MISQGMQPHKKTKSIFFSPFVLFVNFYYSLLSTISFQRPDVHPDHAPTPLIPLNPPFGLFQGKFFLHSSINLSFKTILFCCIDKT